MPALAGLSLQIWLPSAPSASGGVFMALWKKPELVVRLGCDLIWKRGSNSGCPCQVLALGGLRSTWSACEMFMGGIWGSCGCASHT